MNTDWCAVHSCGNPSDDSLLCPDHMGSIFHFCAVCGIAWEPENMEIVSETDGNMCSDCHKEHVRPPVPERRGPDGGVSGPYDT